MGIVSKLFGDDSSASRRQASTPSDYIDLSDYAATEKSGEAAATTLIRFAELRQLDDLKHFANYVYDGNMLIIDFQKVSGDEIVLRRLTNELRKIAQDTGGDLAGLGEHHILLTPTGIKVDRRKMAINKETGEAEVQKPRAAPVAPAPRAPPAPVAESAGPAPRANGTRGARVGGR